MKTTSTGRSLFWEQDHLLKRTWFVSPQTMSVLFIVVALLVVSGFGYVVVKVGVAINQAIVAVLDRPTLLQNPEGNIVAIREADGTIIKVLDPRYAARRKEIGNSYELGYVGMDWNR